MCLNEPPQRPSSPRPRHDASVAASPHAAASPLRGTDHTGAAGGRTHDAARRIDQQARSGDVFPGVELEILVAAGVLAVLHDEHALREWLRRSEEHTSELQSQLTIS